LLEGREPRVVVLEDAVAFFLVALMRGVAVVLV